MTAIIERTQRATIPAASPAPAALFQVRGNPHGHEVSAPAGTLDEIVACIDAWTRADDDCTGYWLLSDDYSEPVTMIVRPADDLVPGSRWQAHLVRLLPGARQGLVLPTTCGERLTLLEAEMLPAGMGMPCENCLLDLPRSQSPIW